MHFMNGGSAEWLTAPDPPGTGSMGEGTLILNWLQLNTELGAGGQGGGLEVEVVGGGDPPLHRGHLLEPPHPASRYHQLIAPDSRKPKQDKQQQRRISILKHTHTHAHTKENTKRTQQRSGPLPPQHLGELLLFSGCSPRPLDISGGSASRKR